jgi:hypothetical protein
LKEEKWSYEEKEKTDLKRQLDIKKGKINLFDEKNSKKIDSKKSNKKI